MKVFFMYLGINIVLLFYHALMFFAGAMGLGGRTGTESTGVLFYHIFLFALFGAAPNFIVFILAFFMRKSVKQNAIWATVFSVLIITGYFIIFSSVFS
jgi:hypothetical protein